MDGSCQASRAGIGTLDAGSWVRSDRMRMLWCSQHGRGCCRIAHCLERRGEAVDAVRSDASQVMSRVSVRKASHPARARPSSGFWPDRQVGQDRLAGLPGAYASACVASAQQIGARADESSVRLITSSSRIGSIGGLVTCAKFCLK